MTIRTALRSPVATILAVAVTASVIIMAVTLASGVNPWTGVMVPVLHQIAGWF